MSTRRSLRCADYVEKLKECTSLRPFTVGGVEIRFVKSPDVTALQRIFSEMENSSVLVYHSDDLAGSLRCSDGMLWFNGDIAGCDSSQSKFVFENIRRQFPTRLQETVARLLEQCQLPIRLGHGPGSLLYKPQDYFEYSGSTLTTILNNTASRCIAMRLVEAWDPTSTIELNKHRLTEAVGRCGWSVTMEWCRQLEGIQFLKHSPHYTIFGEVDAVLNAGVILRAMGRCRYDLPGSGCLERRATSFMRNWVAGLQHAGDTDLLRTLRAKFPGGDPDHQESWLTAHMEASHERRPIHPTSLCGRYGISEASWQELVRCVREARIGDVIRCPAANRILHVDYGLCSTWEQA